MDFGKNTQELQENNIYIVKGNRASNYETVEKIKVLELTENTVLYCYLDNENQHTERVLFSKFNHEYIVIENLGEAEGCSPTQDEADYS